MLEITSSENRRFRYFESLLTTKGIDKNQRALLFGSKVVEEILLGRKESVEALIVPVGYESRAHNLDCFSLKKPLFERLDVFGTRSPIAVVRVPKIEADLTRAKLKGCTLVVPFQEPSNVGSVLRSAAAFDVENIFLTQEAAHPFHPRSSRAAAGAVFEHNYFQVSKLADFTFEALPVITLDFPGNVREQPSVENLDTFLFPSDFILVAGLEGPGVPKTLSPRYRITIPVTKKVESLNGPTATAIALFSWFTRR